MALGLVLTRGHERRLRRMRMNPAKGYEVMIVLVVEDGLFVLCRAGVCGSALFGDDEVSYSEFVPLQTPRQNAAGLDIAVRVGLSQIQESTHHHRRDNHLAHS